MSKWQGFYSTAQVSRLTRIPIRTLYEWRELGIIAPSVAITNEHGQTVDVGFSYADLTIIKIMRALREDALDLKSVFVALHHLYERLGPPSKGWADARVYIVEGRVYAEKSDEWHVTAASQFGQKVETRLFGDMFEQLRALEEPGEILIPGVFRQYVEINPTVMGGEPVVRDTRLPTSVLASLKERGKSVGQIAHLYRPLSRKVISKAIEFGEYLNEPPTKAGTAAA